MSHHLLRLVFTSFFLLGHAQADSFGSGFNGYSVSPLLQNDRGANIPLSYGGLAVDPGNINYLLITGTAGGSGAGIYRVYVLRDTQRHITGFLWGHVSLLATSPKAGSGLSFFPDGSLVYSIESGSGGVDFAAVPPGSSIATSTGDFIPDTPGALNIVPPGFGGAGQLKVSSANGKFYRASFFGVPGLGSPQLVATLPNPIEGFAYIKAGSPGFALDSMLVAEGRTGNIVAYSLDASGNPIPGTRHVFFAGPPFAAPAGLAVDPYSGDLLVSTRNNSSSAIFRISGFRPLPLSSGGAITSCREITSSGNYTLANDLTGINSPACIQIHDAIDVNLDCGFRKISSGWGALSIVNSTRFSIRNCILNSAGGSANIVNLVNSEIGEIRGSTMGTLTSPYVGVFAVWKSDGLQVYNNTIYGQVQLQYASAWLSDNRITCPAISGRTCVGGILSAYGNSNRFDRNTIDGMSNPRAGSAIGGDLGIHLQDDRNTLIQNNEIRNVRFAGILTGGNIKDLVVQGNTISTTTVGIQGLVSNSWDSVGVSDNVVANAAILFHFIRYGGLRPANFDNHGRSADKAVLFRNVNFVRNRMVGTWNPGNYSTFLPVFEYGLYFAGLTQLPGERAPKPSEIQFGNIGFWQNDFGTTQLAPYFGSPVIPGVISDGGGNRCQAPGSPGYPLTCVP